MAKNVTSADIFGGMFQNMSPQYNGANKKEEKQEEQVSEASVSIMLHRSCLHEFSSFYGHPFRVVEDEKMLELAESIRDIGIVEPLIVRADQSSPGKYEIIAGHRRNYAAGLAGLTEVPVRIEELDDDAAAEIMVDSNNRREVLLPSEKAWAYRTKAEARKHQGKRTDLLTEDELAADSGGIKGIGEKNGDSVSTVKRYIRLTYLIPEFLKLVDEEKLSVGGGYLISFFDNSMQQYLHEYCLEHNMFPDKAQIVAMAEVNSDGKLDKDAVVRIMSKRESEKKPEKKNFTIRDSQIRKYFPDNATRDYIESVIMELLENWSKEKA